MDTDSPPSPSRPPSPPEAEYRPYRPLRTTLWRTAVFGGLLAAAAAMRYAWDAKAEREYLAELDACRAAGLPTAWWEWPPEPDVPDPENLVTAVERAVAEFPVPPDGDIDALRSASEPPQPEGPSLPYYRRPASPAAAGALAWLMDDAQPFLDRLAGARSLRRVRWNMPWPRPGQPLSLPGWGAVEVDIHTFVAANCVERLRPARVASQEIGGCPALVRLGVVDALRRGDHRSLVERWRDLVTLQRFLTCGLGDPAEFEDMLAALLPGLRIGAASPPGPGPSAASREQIAGLIAELLDEGDLDRTARLLALCGLSRAADAGEFLMTGGGPLAIPSPGVWLRAYLAVVRPPTLRDATRRLAEKRAEALPFRPDGGRIDAAEVASAVSAEGTRADWRTAAPEGDPHGLRLHLFGGHREKSPARWWAEETARRRTLAAAVAARLFRADHGRPASSWGDLVPAYLPRVPADPGSPDGAPLTLRPTPTGVEIRSVLQRIRVGKWGPIEQDGVFLLADGTAPAE
jgi:hypothetical protein